VSVFVGREGSNGENVIRKERKDRVNSVSQALEEASRDVSTIQREGGKSLGCKRKGRKLSEDPSGFRNAGK